MNSINPKAGGVGSAGSQGVENTNGGNGRLSVSGEAAEAKAGSSSGSQLQRSSSSSSLDGLTLGKPGAEKRKLANRRMGLGGLHRSHSSDSLKSNSSTSSSRSASSISSDKMKAGMKAAAGKIKMAATRAKEGMAAIMPQGKGSKGSNSAEGGPLSRLMEKVKGFAERHKPHTDKNAEAQNSDSEMKDTTPPIPPRPRTRANSDPAPYSGRPKHSDLRAELEKLDASLDKTLDKVQKEVNSSLEKSGVTTPTPPKPRPRTRAYSDPGPSGPVKHSDLNAELQKLNASLDETLDKVQKEVNASLEKSGVTTPTPPKPRPRTRVNSDPALYSGRPKHSDLRAELEKLDASLDKTLDKVQKEVNASLEKSGVTTPTPPKPRPRTRANSDPSPSRPKHSELRAELQKLNASLDETMGNVQREVDASLERSGVKSPAPSPRTRANSDPGPSGPVKYSDLQRELEGLKSSQKTKVPPQVPPKPKFTIPKHR